jgi:hypothetical protein
LRSVEALATLDFTVVPQNRVIIYALDIRTSQMAY